MAGPYALALLQGNGGGGGFFMLVWFAVIVWFVVAAWKVFTKANQPGWAVLIPIYNTLVMLKIVGRPLWWFFLMLIPLVNLVIALIVSIDLAKSFGKGVGFGLGLFFLSPIFILILGLGSAEYKGPAAAAA